MSKHRIERTARDAVVDRIAERVAQLLEPWTEHVAQRVPRGGRLVEEKHVIEHPGLLHQLGDPGIGGTAGVGSSSGGPSAPIHLGPLSTLQDITAGVDLWWSRVDRLGSRAGQFALAAALGDIRADRPQDLTAAVGRLNDALSADLPYKLRRIVQAAPTLPDETLWNLDREAMRWWASARIATTWDDPPRKLNVPCPVCSAVGKLLVRFFPTVAVCVGCSAAFDRLALDQLGEHLQLVADELAAARTERLIERRACTTCGHEHDHGDFADPDVYRAHTPGSLIGRTTPEVVGTETA